LQTLKLIKTNQNHNASEVYEQNAPKCAAPSERPWQDGIKNHLMLTVWEGHSGRFPNMNKWLLLAVYRFCDHELQLHPALISLIILILAYLGGRVKLLQLLQLTGMPLIHCSLV
jgi:hypothetical protein